MKKNPLLYCFLITLFLFTSIDILKDDKKFSDLENRNLKSRPKFSLGKYFDGTYPKNYEGYMSDQFLMRNIWIDLKSRSEYVLGKLENNDIIYGKNGYLFEKFTKADKERIESSVNSINTFIENVDIPVSVLIAPNSYEVYKELLPSNINLVSQEDGINEIYSKIKGGNNINLLDEFKGNSSYLYYKTDHHWTTEGAYLAYCEFMKSIGEKPISLEDYKEINVEEFYGTYYSKAKPFNVSSDTLTYYEFDNITLEINGKKFNSLYDLEKLKTRDKYSTFIYDNNPLTIVRNTKLNNNKKLLVFKDSYANSMIPFLTQNYEEIHVIDLRSFHSKISEYISMEEFEDILILYNYINFTRDGNLFKLKS